MKNDLKPLVCHESVLKLEEYKRKGIKLMPHQQEFLNQHYAKFRKHEAAKIGE